MSELTFVSFYALLVWRNYRWYPWTAIKVARIGVGSGELTLENGSNGRRWFGLIPSGGQLALSSRRIAKVVGGPAVVGTWRMKKRLARGLSEFLPPTEQIRRLLTRGRCFSIRWS